MCSFVYTYSAVQMVFSTYLVNSSHAALRDTSHRQAKWGLGLGQLSLLHQALSVWYEGSKQGRE